MAYKNKKKSPLKGADPVLVKGAYEAAGGGLYQQYVEQYHRAMMNLANQFRSWDFGTGAQRIIDANGRLPQGEINGIRKQLGGKMKDDYINGDNAKKEELTAEVQKMHEEMGQYADLRKNLAENFKSKSLSQSFLRTPQGQEMLEIMKDQTRLTKKKCPEGQDDCDDKGSLGVMMTDWKLINDTNKAKRDIEMQIRQMEKLYQDGAVYYDGTDLDALYDQLNDLNALIESKPKKWTSISEMANSISLIDQSAIDLLAQARNSAYLKGKDTLPEDKTKFQRDKAGQIVKDVIMKSSNQGSLIYDVMFGDKSFYDNMVTHIMDHKYSDFGLTEEYLDSMGIFDDGTIDEQEAQHIANEFIGDGEFEENETLQKELQEYFVQHLENNYNLGKEDRRQSYLEYDESLNKTQIEDRDADGNYIPDSQREDNTTSTATDTSEENIDNQEDTSETDTSDANINDDTDVNDDDDEDDDDDDTQQ